MREENAPHVDIRDRWVHFRIQDVRIPDPQELQMRLYGDYLLQGRVVDVTDNGTGSQGVFVVVKVEGLEQELVVPIGSVLGVL